MEMGIHSHLDVQESRVALLKELVECLQREREILADLHIQDLWTVVEEKQRILQDIEALSPQASEAGSGGKGADMKPHFSENPASAHTIARLKEEIRERTRENAAFIQDSLQFVDELVALITGDPKDNGTYSPKGGQNRSHRSRLYGREV